MQRTLLLDIDGVVRNIIPTLTKIYKREIDPDYKGNSNSIKEFNLYHTYDHFNTDKDCVNFFFKDNAQEVFETSRPYQTKTSQLLTGLQEDYRIHIVTYQEKGNEQFTLNWLEKHKIPYNAITFTGKKTSVRGHAAIDDAIKNLDAYKAYGVRTICINRPWNKGWTGENYDSLEKAVNALRGK